MASTQALSNAAQDRKARLAQLKSLKRKQPSEEQQDEAAPAPKSPRNDTAEPDGTSKYLSGRNYDSETRGARLGFENNPSEGKDTLERKAATLAEETKRQAEAEAKSDAPLDLFKIQPKKPTADLRRLLDEKLDVLGIRTDNAIARLVRERISGQQKAAQARLNGAAKGGDAEAAGIEGTTLVEATNMREREAEEEARREREEEEALLDAS